MNVFHGLSSLRLPDDPSPPEGSKTSKNLNHVYADQENDKVDKSQTARGGKDVYTYEIGLMADWERFELCLRFRAQSQNLDRKSIDREQESDV